MERIRGPDEILVARRAIVVGLLHENDAGALNYALRRALLEQSLVRVVRPIGSGRTARHPSTFPLDVIDREGEVSEVLLEESREADMMIVQTPMSEAEALGDPVLTRLRRGTHCVLVEVDSEGRIVRIEGPNGDVNEYDKPLVKPFFRTGQLAVSDITVGVDGSEASLAALDWAIDFAGDQQTIRLVTAYSPKVRESEHAARASAVRLLDDAISGRRASSAAKDVKFVVDVEGGNPVEVLVGHAETSKLLVLGRHGTRGMIHNALASVTDACARLSPCPVAIVPPVRS